MTGEMPYSPGGGSEEHAPVPVLFEVLLVHSLPRDTRLTASGAAALFEISRPSAHRLCEEHQIGTFTSRMDTLDWDQLLSLATEIGKIPIADPTDVALYKLASELDISVSFVYRFANHPGNGITPRDMRALDTNKGLAIKLHVTAEEAERIRSASSRHEIAGPQYVDIDAIAQDTGMTPRPVRKHISSLSADCLPPIFWLKRTDADRNTSPHLLGPDADDIVMDLRLQKIPVTQFNAAMGANYMGWGQTYFMRQAGLLWKSLAEAGVDTEPLEPDYLRTHHQQAGRVWPWLVLQHLEEFQGQRGIVATNFRTLAHEPTAPHLAKIHSYALQLQLTDPKYLEGYGADLDVLRSEANTTESGLAVMTQLAAIPPWEARLDRQGPLAYLAQSAVESVMDVPISKAPESWPSIAAISTRQGISERRLLAAVVALRAARQVRITSENAVMGDLDGTVQPFFAPGLLRKIVPYAIANPTVPRPTKPA